MRLISSNGRTLEIREIGPVSLRLTASTQPLPLMINVVADDAAARACVRALMAAGVYAWERLV